MILIHLLIAGCIALFILLLGIGVGMVLRAKRMDRENREMEAILKKYGKDKKDSASGGTPGGDGGDIPHRL